MRPMLSIWRWDDVLAKDGLFHGLPSRRGTTGACRYLLGCIRRFQLRARY
jgi:hypothetical protein